MSNILYFLIPFIDYLPRPEAQKKLAKLNNIYDKIIESKRKSMIIGDFDKKINNNTADLLDYMIHSSNDPDNPTLTDDELRVRIIILNFTEDSFL